MNLSDVKEDNRKMAATLEGVMKAHNELQSAMTDALTQLGQRDSQIAQFKIEK